MRKRRCRGFTFVEMMVVTIIIALSLALITPVMIDVQREKELNSFTETLLLDAFWAREEALKYDCSVAILFRANKDYEVIAYRPEKEVLKKKSYSDRIRVLYPFSQSFDGISFHSDGSARNNTLKICAGDKVRYLTVYQEGRVRISEEG